MIAYMRAVRRHVNNDDGASAVEYGLLVAAIAAVIVVVVFALGNVVKNKFTNTCTNIEHNGTPAAGATCNDTTP
jgi:pilus assembly protein Flp/PilA